LNNIKEFIEDTSSSVRVNVSTASTTVIRPFSLGNESLLNTTCQYSENFVVATTPLAKDALNFWNSRRSLNQQIPELVTILCYLLILT
jgi:hypothetical protein